MTSASTTWINTPANNFGFAIENYNATDGLDFSSKEFADATKRPKLTITYGSTPPANTPPTAVANSYTIAEGGTLLANDTTGATGTTNDDSVLRNDTDPDGNPLTAVLVSNPTHGTLTLNANGTFTYTHDGSETTSDSFTYQASDGVALSNVVTVSITITPVNDPPVTVANSYTVAEGGALLATDTTGATGTTNDDSVLRNDTDAEGNALTAILVGLPTNGSVTLNADGTFNYTHNGSETTSDSFTYQSYDGTSLGNVVTVSITVTPVNDPPVTVADSYTVVDGGTLVANDTNGSQAGTNNDSVLRNDTDAEGNTLTAVLDSTTAHGTLVLNNNGTFTYTNNHDGATSDTFTYHATDGVNFGNTVTVTIAITPNSPPSTAADTYTVLQGTSLTTTDTNGSQAGTNNDSVLLNDTDSEGQALTAVVDTTTAHGTLTLNANGTFTYVHNGSAATTDTFTYHAHDGFQAGNVVTVTINITPNAPPTTVANSYTLAQGGTLTTTDTNGSQAGTNNDSVLLNDTDPELNPLTAVLDTTTANGTLTLNSNGTFTYVHNNSATTSDSFTYHAFDGTSAGNVVTVTFTITPNTPPTTVANSYSLTKGTSLTTTDTNGSQAGTNNDSVLLNDTDPELNPLTAVLDTTVTHGTLSFNADGTFTYTHNNDAATSDSFTYHAFDGTNAGNVVTVTFTITPPASGNTVNFQQGANGYTGATDARIRGDSPTNNGGAIDTLQMHGNPDKGTLMRWDVSSIPAGSQVQSATITVYISNATKDTFTVYGLLRQWSETASTWNSTGIGSGTAANWTAAGAQQIDADRSNTSLGAVAPLAGQTTTGELLFYTITLNAAGVALVQSWVNNSANNFGITLQNYNATDGLDFSSKEFADATKRPKLTITYLSPLNAAGAVPASAAGATLTQADLAAASQAAAARWIAATPAALQDQARATIASLSFAIADLSGSTLGLHGGTTIQIDQNAAGFGWFIDATPWDDAEFAADGTAIDGRAAGKMDLVSAIAHEIGHALGYDHDAGVMAESLAAGFRTVGNDAFFRDYELV